MSRDIAIAGDVFALLTDPSTYGDGNGPVEVIETHAAYVFFSGDRALKVKKAVAYPYLDFSTRELRAAAIRREVELNAGNAPGLYLGLTGITRSADGELALGGDGETVETALAMRRFDQDRLLDRLAESGGLDLALMDPLAEAIARAHDAAPPIDGFGQMAALVHVLEGNIVSLSAHGALFPPERIQLIAQASRAGLARARNILTERAANGFVRRCHGDLHLGNLVMWQGKPTLFDALEFDEELATIDVLHDLAFLLMDLVHRDLKAHANLLLNAYLARAEPGALNGLVAMGLMMSLRAAVRAKVEADRSEPIEEVAAKGEAEAAARSYFDLAEACLVPSPPRLVAIGGLSGSGKSTIAANIAARLDGPCGALHLRSDVERKALAGVAPAERLPAESYTRDAAKAVYRRLKQKTGMAIAAGASVIVDAVHAGPEERDAMARIATETGVRFSGLWLDADAQVLTSRVAARKGDASDADARVVARQLTYDLGEIDWARIGAGGSLDQTLALTRHQLELEQ